MDRSDLGASGSASIPFQETASRGQFRSYPRLSRTPAALSGGVYSASSARKPASSITSIAPRGLILVNEAAKLSAVLP